MEPSPCGPVVQQFDNSSSSFNPESNEELVGWKQGILSQLSPEITGSTYSIEMIEQDIHSPDVYKLHPQILSGTPISENMRARIRSFLMSQGSKQWMMRDSLALACTYLDLYLSRQTQEHQCRVRDLQTISIACLILAQKMLDGKFPKISFEVFQKEELLSWEKKVAKTLQYRLSPPTFFTFAENFVLRWNSYTKEKKYLSFVREIPQEEPNWSLRCFYEQLDCIFMVLKSLSWPLETLVANLFFLNLRRLNFPQLPQLRGMSNKQFAEMFFANDEFKFFFSNFLNHYTTFKEIRLIPELGVFLKSFMILGASSKRFPIKQSLDHLRVWQKLQTCHPESYILFKSILQVQNANQT